MTRVLYVYDADMIDTNEYFSQAFQLLDVEAEGLCVNHPAVLDRVLRDEKFRIRTVPTVLVFSNETSGVVDKYETSEHYSVLFKRLGEGKGKGEREGDIANLPPPSHESGDPPSAPRSLGKTRGEGRRTGARGESVYDVIASTSGGIVNNVDDDISTLTQGHNDVVDRGLFASTRGARETDTRETARRFLARPDPEADGEDMVRAVGLGVGTDRDADGGDGGDGGDIGVEDMVRAINGNEGIDSADDDQTGAPGTERQSRAQKEKSAAVATLASRMKREREESEEGLARKPMHVR